MDKPITGHLLRHVSLRQLQIFEAITREGSFTRAADTLFLTQPTVSMQIKKLEDGLGLPLFEQIGKQIYLTDAGKVLLEHTRQILDSFANLEMEFADMQGMKTGILRLAVVTTAKYFAPRALGKFCERFPGVDVALKVTNRERLLERMGQNLDDLYIMGRPPESGDTVFEPYMANPLVVLAPRTHPLASESRIAPSRLAEFPMIMREHGSGTRMAVEDFFVRRGIKLQIRMELGSNEAIKHAIDAGLGISVLSQHTLALHGEDSRLVMLDVEGFPIPWQWCVGYVKGKRLSVIAKTFLSFIKSESDSIMRTETSS